MSGARKELLTILFAVAAALLSVAPVLQVK